MIPTRSRDSRTRSVNSGRAVTHVVEPRRVVAEETMGSHDPAGLTPRRSTGMQRRVGPTPVRRRWRRHTSGQWESAQHNAGTAVVLVSRPSPSDADKSLHASGVKGPTLRAAQVDALVAGRAASQRSRASACMSTTGL